MPLSLESTHHEALLALAREALTCHVQGRRAPVSPEDDEILQCPAGAFVTLRTSAGALRGCIGRTAADTPLALTVSRMAVAAGSADPRFDAVRPDEIEDLTFEISVLGPMERCDPEDVVVGRDGLVVQRGRRRGLLLPQVATEQGWTREQFLSGTCRKAGLEMDAWRQGVELFRFEAVHFEEPDR